MKIPPFPLPSNRRIEVHFRIPTVEDGMLFAETLPEQEEAVTTEYLNHIQDVDKNKGKTLFDSGEWTVEDRRTALWWIFIASRDLPIQTFSYKCNFCGEKHYIDLNVVELGNTSVALSVKPERKIEFHANAEVFDGVVKPINGYAAEHLETLRNLRDEHKKGSLEYRKRDNQLARSTRVRLYVGVAPEVKASDNPSSQASQVDWPNQYLVVQVLTRTWDPKVRWRIVHCRA